jgi:nicotinamidase-related amidase
MSGAAAGLKVDPRQAALLVVDVQERLAAAMPDDLRERCQKNVLVLIELARRAGLPVVVSEQYPKGLGPTVGPIAEALAGLDARRFEKVEFGCPEAPAFAPIWTELRREQWLVTGMETHICVYQSARSLLDRGARVQVVRDAVASRTAENLAVGLDLIERAGGVVTSTETVVFDVLGRAGTEDFKALSRLIK